ncbi:MAG: pre-toxin TG domain-containing protein [Gemmatimonadota bacterium]
MILPETDPRGARFVPDILELEVELARIEAAERDANRRAAEVTLFRPYGDIRDMALIPLNRAAGQLYAKFIPGAAETLIAFIPAAGNVVAVLEGILGRTLITDRKLSGTERVLGAALACVPWSRVIRGAGKAGAQTVAYIAKRTGQSPRRILGIVNSLGKLSAEDARLVSSALQAAAAGQELTLAERAAAEQLLSAVKEEGRAVASAVAAEKRGLPTAAADLRGVGSRATEARTAVARPSARGGTAATAKTAATGKAAAKQAAAHVVEEGTGLHESVSARGSVAGTMAEKVWAYVILKVEPNVRRVRFPVRVRDRAGKWIEVKVEPDFLPTARVGPLGIRESITRAEDISEALWIGDSKYIGENRAVRLDDQIRGMISLAKENRKVFRFFVKKGGGVTKGVRSYAKRIGAVIEVVEDTSGRIN